MQQPPDPRFSPDCGIKRGRLKDLQYMSSGPISEEVEEGQSSKQPREGFTAKNYLTISGENREVASLREQAGWITKGSSAAESREDPPTQKRENARPVEPPKRKGECGDWGGGLAEPGGHI
jgi:hypothetical protein